MRSFFTLIIFQLFLVPLLFAQSISIELDSLLQAHHRGNGFEGVVLVAENGESVFEWACGFANRDSATELKMDTRFPIGDITKHLTAIVALQLIENDQLSYSATVKEALPHLDIPGGTRVTVRHLLSNTSGFPGENEEVYRKRNSPRIIVERTTSQIKEYNPLGRFDKNNINYLLLGMIIEEKTGRTWQEVMHEKLIAKLELEGTGFLLWNDYPENSATGYAKTDTGKIEEVNLYHIENYFAAGAIYSTARDLLKIDRALQDGELLNNENYQQLCEIRPDRDRTRNGCSAYVYPFVETQPEVVEVKSTLGGFGIVWVRIPKVNRTLIIMSNDPEFEVDTFGDLANLKELLIQKIAPCGNEHFEPCGL